LRHIENRYLIIVKPKMPFVEWINSLPGSERKISIGDVEEDATSHLVPISNYDIEPDHILKRHFSEIFELQLWEWYTDKTLWPANRTYQKFKKWFEIEIHTMVYDFGDNAIRYDDL